MDRLSFLESVSGIEHPELIQEFFDHFLAIKQIVENNGTVSVIKNTKNSIQFLVEFNNPKAQTLALGQLTTNPYIEVYGRPIRVDVEILTDRLVQIKLK